MQNKFKYLILVAFLFAGVGVCNEWMFEYRQASAKYMIYGGGLGDPIAPSKKQAKISFEVTGNAAMEIFESIGPDIKDPCSAVQGIRFRSKDAGKLTCIRDQEANFSCYFGFDLNTGKSIGGSVC